MTQMQLTAAGRLITLRIIWAALVLGQLVFLGVIVFRIWPNQRHAIDLEMLRTEFYISIAMLVTCIVVGFFVRRVAFGQRLPDGSIDPAKYSTGNIIFWAMCEGPSFFGLVIMMQAGEALPYAMVPAVAMAMQVLSFPTGRPLRSSES